MKENQKKWKPLTVARSFWVMPSALRPCMISLPTLSDTFSTEKEEGGEGGGGEEEEEEEEGGGGGGGGEEEVGGSMRRRRRRRKHE